MASIIELALSKNASDIHIENAVAVTLRTAGRLVKATEPVNSQQIEAWIDEIANADQRAEFQSKGSVDFSTVIGPARCRINMLMSQRGKGLVIRILTTFQASLRDCNLHPELAEVLKSENGLIIVTGPTGCGKSTTLAALIEEINRHHDKHIITLENPIEFVHRNRKSLIRQREVGRHTESFEQGILDSLREDPDVLVIGEMRTPESMRLTLTAAETGHLVLATMHSGTAADAISRMVSSFSGENQNSVRAQIADCLVGVIAQKLEWLPEHQMRVPVCEVLMTNYAAQSKIRSGDFAQLLSVIQTGGSEKMWTFERYRQWVKSQSRWVKPEQAARLETPESPAPVSSPAISPIPKPKEERLSSGVISSKRRTTTVVKTRTKSDSSGRIEIPDFEMDLQEIVSEMIDEDE